MTSAGVDTREAKKPEQMDDRVWAMRPSWASPWASTSCLAWWGGQWGSRAGGKGRRRGTSAVTDGAGSDAEDKHTALMQFY